MKRRDFLFHLSQQGCRFVREGGEHSILENPAINHRTSVPRHREIPDFTARWQGFANNLVFQSLSYGVQDKSWAPKYHKASSIYLKPSPKRATSQSPEVPPPLDYSIQFLPHVRAQWNVQSTSLIQSHPFRGS